MSVPGAAPGTKKVKPQSLFQEKPAEKVASAAAGSSSRRPDRSTHDAEVKAIEAQIEEVQATQNDLRTKISKSGPGAVNEERQKIRSELNALRDTQAGYKASRGKTQEQIRGMQDRMQTKIKDLNASRAKFPFKSGAEVDAKIASLEKQVESGSLKLVDERKTLNEISTLRKSRKTVEGFQSQQASIEADRKAIDEAKAKLDDPEAKAASNQYSDLKSQLDKLTGQADEVHASRNKLFEQRDANKKKLDDLYSKKREVKDAFRSANDAYFTKMNEDRARRMEKQKAEKEAYEESKRQEINERLLEEASQPAFEREIEDCSTLIDYFNRGGGKSAVPAPKLASNVNDSKAPKLPAHDLRKVEDLPQGATVLKKKGDDEEEGLFGGMGGGKKNKKGRKGASAAGPSKEEEGTTAAQGLNLPISTLSALLALEVPTPATTQDIPKTVEGLEAKQKYFKENQAKTTEERIASAKARIERAMKTVNGDKSSSKEDKDKKTSKDTSGPTVTRRDSSEPMQVGDASVSEAAQANGTTQETVPEESLATVNGEGEAVSAEDAQSLAQE